jgi:hypothetical protein
VYCKSAPQFNLTNTPSPTNFLTVTDRGEYTLGMAHRCFSVDKTYRPVFEGRFTLQRHSYDDTYDEITKADKRARTVVEEGGAIEAIIFEELGKKGRLWKVRYCFDEIGKLKRIVNV